MIILYPRIEILGMVVIPPSPFVIDHQIPDAIQILCLRHSKYCLPSEKIAYYFVIIFTHDFRDHSTKGYFVLLVHHSNTVNTPTRS